MLKLSPELDISWLHLRLEKAGDVAKIRKLSRIIFPVSDSALFVLFCVYVFFFSSPARRSLVDVQTFRQRGRTERHTTTTGK